MGAVRTGKKRQHFLAYDPPEYGIAIASNPDLYGLGYMQGRR